MKSNYWDATKHTGALLLEDGNIFYGYRFGAKNLDLSKGRLGEVIFYTGMSGYQEVLTDPSYCGQMVNMTYPQIGNYGINLEDMESKTPALSGLLVHELSRTHSNWRSTMGLEEYMEKHGIPGLTGIDTRMLTHHIRERGATNAYILSPIPKEKEEMDAILSLLKKEPLLSTTDPVSKVTCKAPYEWEESCGMFQERWERDKIKPSLSHRVAVLDFGCKQNSLRNFRKRGCKVKVFPANTTPEEIMRFSPNGLFLSNGPGDPMQLYYAAKTVASLLGRLPIFGVCMGHQVLAIAMGAKTFKLKFGHHGANQPVLDLNNKRVIITSQNHCYAVDPESLPPEVKVSHINLNDKTVAGISLPKQKAFSVQYHPEACPGPRDAQDHFDQFIQML